MTNLVIFLMVVGVLAILLEIIMPGFDSFISGIVGVLALVAAAILTVIYVEGGVILVGINLTVLFLGCYFMYMFFKRKQFQSRIFLNENLAEDLPAIDLSSLMGKEGKVVAALRPYGEVDFNGVRVEVSSNGPLVDKGVRVKVTETHANKVVVSVVDGN